jgi:hypothetical protein
MKYIKEDKMWNPIKNYKENKKYENEQWENKRKRRAR